MSKAFKCDRCKQCFDPWSMEDHREFGSIPEYMCMVPDGHGGFDCTYREEGRHLCPDCNTLFASFMTTPLKYGKIRKKGKAPNEKDGV